MNRNGEHVVIFSTNGALRRELTEAIGRRDWPLVHVASCGEALRHIALMQPAAIVVMATDESAATLIAELRQRRPQLPLVALAERHDETIERRLRAAGASAYVTDLEEAAVTIAAAHPQLEVSLHSGCSPPQRARAPARIRGRPRQSRAE